MTNGTDRLSSRSAYRRERRLADLRAAVDGERLRRLTLDNEALHEAYGVLAKAQARMWINFANLPPFKQRLINWIVGREVIGLEFFPDPDE